jgi:hypothetical protein
MLSHPRSRRYADSRVVIYELRLDPVFFYLGEIHDEYLVFGLDNLREDDPVELAILDC